MTKRSMNDAAVTPEYQKEMLGSRTSNYNETVRANNRRVDQGKAMKRLPNYRTVGAQEWKPDKLKDTVTRKRVSTK